QNTTVQPSSTSRKRPIIPPKLQNSAERKTSSMPTRSSRSPPGTDGGVAGAFRGAAIVGQSARPARHAGPLAASASPSCRLCAGPSKLAPLRLARIRCVASAPLIPPRLISGAGRGGHRPSDTRRREPDSDAAEARAERSEHAQNPRQTRRGIDIDLAGPLTASDLTLQQDHPVHEIHVDLQLLKGEK